MRTAFFGDVHGEIQSLEKLYDMLGHYSLDNIEHLGDLVDRGPDSGAVVQFCREKKIHGVLGNHEGVIMQYPVKGTVPKNEDKARTLRSLNEDQANWDYFKTLPLHKIQHDNLLQVHAGVHPYLPFDQQGLKFCTVQQVHPDFLDKNPWFEQDKKGVKEEVHRANGFRRWYEAYEGPYNIVGGHNVLSHDRAFRHQFPNGNSYFGLDTGSWFSKNITAIIWPDMIFVSSRDGEYGVEDCAKVPMRHLP